ncbi:hypothetical protein CIB48_g154 [Xylaria polymorpha]|nr:hypothetical protein CIB48_g154 [Xylaria polymorpha]
MRHARGGQNESSLAGLSAQRTAMLTALQNIQADSAALTPLSNLLASNTMILQSSLQEADAVITNSTTHRPPAIDDLLVAPTVVGNQLYDVVAEERALGDAIFVLGRAVERGRIFPRRVRQDDARPRPRVVPEEGPRAQDRPRHGA